MLKRSLALCLFLGLAARAEVQPGAPSDAFDAPALTLRDAVRAARDEASLPAQTISLLQNKLGLTEGQARGAFLALSENDVGLDQLAMRLGEIAAALRMAQAGLAPQQGDDPKIAALKAKAQSAVADGRLGDADDALAAIESEAPGQAADAAQLIALRANLALARLRYRDAAERFGEAAGKLPAGENAARSKYLRAQYDALFQQGDAAGGEALTAAAAVARRGLGLASRADDPLAWAAWQNDLGAALERLGEAPNGAAQLTEAIAAYRAALEERTRARAPLDWAMTQASLGDALLIEAAREKSGQSLTKAIAAYGAALDVLSRDNAPPLWARAEYNLGNALETLGEREGGTARLNEAVAAYSATLEERTRERAPLRWAKATGNQGVALMLIAQKTHDAVIAKKALGQLTAAADAAREAGDQTAGAGYQSILPAASRLVEALSGQ